MDETRRLRGRRLRPDARRLVVDSARVEAQLAAIARDTDPSIMSFRLKLACIALAVIAASPAASAPKNKTIVGQPAPPFAATTIDKQKFALDALRGKVVVINRWATWCAPCKAEMPMMDMFYRRHQKAGLAMIGITTEDSVPAFHLRKLDAVLSYPLATRARARAARTTTRTASPRPSSSTVAARSATSRSARSMKRASV